MDKGEYTAMKDITSNVFLYTANQNTKISNKVYEWLQRDYNQFYDDGYAMIIEGNMPNYAYDYINRHAKNILSNKWWRY